jgi:acetyl-CoA C-acetyltransferase
MSVTSQVDIGADAPSVWTVLSDLSRLGEWSTSHLGFAGEAPATMAVGTEYVEKLRVLGMPNEVRWTVSTVEDGHRIVQEGKGPMGISIRGEYTVETAGDGSRVVLDQAFSGATVFAIKGQLEREVKAIQDASLGKLREIVQAG